MKELKNDGHIPIENIKFHNPVGEGQYGVVVSGYILQKCNNKHFNTPVALKFSKLNATCEERFDFLYEAEIMRKLNHPNIVELKGTSEDDNRMYIVMELMNQGDLKSYLRRLKHLVDGIDGEPPNREVSSHRLTRMAMDIAKGLSYLAANKFVHRDIALRNCVMNLKQNGDFVVKLADFGLTRFLLDNDDDQKGVQDKPMPVLNASPESLKAGIYTPASDVWSFGTVVWEIITFGADLYTDVTSEDVQLHIMAGNSLAIPSTASSNLKWLMQECWNVDYTYRITAHQIIDYLKCYPRLLTPCLVVQFERNIFDESHYVSNRTQTVRANINNERSRSVYMEMMSIRNANDTDRTPLLDNDDQTNARFSIFNYLSKFLCTLVVSNETEMTKL